VSNDAAYLHGLFEKLINWIERSHLDVEVQDWQVEMV